MVIAVIWTAMMAVAAAVGYRNAWNSYKDLKDLRVAMSGPNPMHVVTGGPRWAFAVGFLIGNLLLAATLTFFGVVGLIAMLYPSRIHPLTRGLVTAGTFFGGMTVAAVPVVLHRMRAKVRAAAGMRPPPSA